MSARKELEEERKRFEADLRKIKDSYQETEKEFNKWKEGVLIFEHSEHSDGDNSLGDDRIRDWEDLGRDEDEDGSIESYEAVGDSFGIDPENEE